MGATGVFSEKLWNFEDSASSAGCISTICGITHSRRVFGVVVVIELLIALPWEWVTIPTVGEICVLVKHLQPLDLRILSR